MTVYSSVEAEVLSTSAELSGGWLADWWQSFST